MGRRGREKQQKNKVSERRENEKELVRRIKKEVFEVRGRKRGVRRRKEEGISAREEEGEKVKEGEEWPRKILESEKENGKRENGGRKLKKVKEKT